MCSLSPSGRRLGEPWRGVKGRVWTREDRFVAAINAGVDKIGGAEDGSPILSAVRSGLIAMERIDQAIVRIVVLKYQERLFENLYVDVESYSCAGHSSANCRAGVYRSLRHPEGYQEPARKCLV